jgi:YtkA-like
MLIASGHLLRSRPHLIAARRHPELGDSAARLLRGLVSGEVVVVLCVVFAAAVLSSLAPHRRRSRSRTRPSPRWVRAAWCRPSTMPLPAAGPRLAEQGRRADSFALRITKGGQPVRGANVTLLFNHLEMQMPTQEYQLTETAPGVYSRAAPALVMVGRWGLLPSGKPLTQYKTGPGPHTGVHLIIVRDDLAYIIHQLRRSDRTGCSARPSPSPRRGHTGCSSTCTRTSRAARRTSSCSRKIDVTRN